MSEHAVVIAGGGPAGMMLGAELTSSPPWVLGPLTTVPPLERTARMAARVPGAELSA
jgi:2-polyprenyl-6-methoxyphenol hydroxylase-like FAD-dependent oxidoreductase